MNEYNLKFISDADIFQHVKDTVSKYRIDIDLEKFNKNLIDPIKLTFDSKVYGKNLGSIIEAEIARQIDKSNTNHIGYFHQNIFHYIGDGWRVPRVGFDIINEEKHLFVELKNKHNTMNSSSSQKTYMRMQSKILKDDQATCMLVEIIATKSQDVPWTVSLDGETTKNKNIRRVSIDKFYDIVTGEKDAFKSLCEILPVILDDVVQDQGSFCIRDSVLEELRKISPDLLSSIYKLAFAKYNGFDSFTVSNQDEH